MLGQPIDVRLAGALPTDFPQAGTPGAPPTSPAAPQLGRPPTPGGLGDFPSLTLPDMPTYPAFGGTFPTYLPPIQSPGQPFDWLSFLGGLGGEVGKFASAFGGGTEGTPSGPSGLQPDLYSLYGEAAPPPDTTGLSLYGPGETAPSVTGFGVGPTDLPPIDLQAPTGAEPAFTLTGAGAPTGAPGVTDIQYPGGTLWPGTQTGFAETTPTAGGAGALGSALPYVVPGAATALGAYGLATAKTPGQRAAAGGATAGGLIGLAGAAGLLAPAVAGPLGIAASLPALFQLASAGWGAFHDPGPTWPEGFLPISQDQPNAAIDPSTGRIMWYTGHGEYAWPSQTSLGQQAGVPDIATPDAFMQAGIFPAGQLLQDPAYRSVVMQILPTYKGAALPADIQSLPEVQAWQAQQRAQAPPGFTLPTPTGAPAPVELLTPGGAVPAPMPAILQTQEQKANPPSWVPPETPTGAPTPTMTPQGPMLGDVYLSQDPDMPAGWFKVPGAQDVYFPQYAAMYGR